MPQVVEQLRAGDAHVGDLVLTAQCVDRAEALTRQAFQPAAELVALAADHMRAEVPIRAGRVTRDAHLLRDVEDDRYRQDVVLPGDATSCLRASVWTFVASTTVSRPALSRWPA